MTLKQIVQAYAHINDLTSLVLPYSATRSLFRLKRRLQEEFDTVVAMEKALVSEYGGTVTDTGTYTFADAEKRAQFAAKQAEMMTQEQDITLPTVDLSKHTSAIRISAASMEALDGVVIFEKEGDA